MLAALLLYMVIFLRAGDIYMVPTSVLPEARHVSVYLPYGYSSAGARRYPVIYSLDGEKWRHGAIMAANVRFLAAIGLGANAIVVAVHTEGHRARDYVPSGAADAFMDYLENDVIP